MDFGALGIYIALFLALYVEVFLLLNYFEHKPAQKSARTPNYFPSVSIIVPVWNEERTLANTLRSLLALEYPKKKLEILIVNDGSTDATEHIAKEFAKKYAQVRLINKENGGKYTALNRGITESKAELVGCLDADSFVLRDALLEAVKKFEHEPETMALIPAMTVHQPRTMLEMMQAVEYTFGVFFKKMFDNLGALNVLPGPFSIYKREVFEKIGLFRPAHNTEDMEIAFRMQKYGLKISNAHTARVETSVPKTVRTLLKQRVRWSQGFLQNSWDYAYMYFNPRYGNFGLFTLPVGLVAFISGLYVAGYLLYSILHTLTARAIDRWLTEVPLQLSAPHLDWFYLNTSMMMFLVIATMSLMLTAILLGKQIAQSKLGALSLLSYFLIFGFLAPLWLARAAWGAVRAKESQWR